MRSRRGAAEVVGSVSMLAITIALLAGASALAVFSISEAARLTQSSDQLEQRDLGTLVSVVMVQTNDTGSYVWLYDYGWTSSPIKAVYVNGSPVPWSSDCSSDWSRSLCMVEMPSSDGDLTVVVGGVSVGATV